MTTADRTPAGAPVPAVPAPDRLRAALSLIRRRTRRMAREWEADRAALIALADAHDQLRERVAALAATWDIDIHGQELWRDFWHSWGVHGLSNVARGRIRQLRDCADELRALLADADKAEEDA